MTSSPNISDRSTLIPKGLVDASRAVLQWNGNLSNVDTLFLVRTLRQDLTKIIVVLNALDVMSSAVEGLLCSLQDSKKKRPASRRNSTKKRKR